MICDISSFLLTRGHARLPTIASLQILHFVTRCSPNVKPFFRDERLAMQTSPNLAPQATTPWMSFLCAKLYITSAAEADSPWNAGTQVAEHPCLEAAHREAYRQEAYPAWHWDSPWAAVQRDHRSQLHWEAA